MSAPIVVIEGLKFGYAQTPIINGIDLRIEPAEVFAILGGNGAGKSTLLKLMLGLLRPQAGRIAIGGRDPIAEARKVRESLAYVPETAAVYPHLNAYENLGYFLDIAGLRKTRAELDAAMDAVALRPEDRRRTADGYSKGMRQKLVLALASLRDVRLLLMDEPGSGLDPEADAQLASSIGRMREEGRCVVMVSHDLEAVTALADRFAFLSGGKVIREGRDLPGLGLDATALRALYARRGEEA